MIHTCTTCGHEIEIECCNRCGGDITAPPGADESFKAKCIALIRECKRVSHHATNMGAGATKTFVEGRLEGMKAVLQIYCDQFAADHGSVAEGAAQVARDLDALPDTGREPGYCQCPDCEEPLLHDDMRVTGTFGGSAEVTARCPACRRDVLFGYVDLWHQKD